MKRKQNQQKNKQKKAKKLEEAYRQYLVPMPMSAWENTKSLEQPTLLKQVSTKTTCSIGEKNNAKLGRSIKRNIPRSKKR